MTEMKECLSMPFTAPTTCFSLSTCSFNTRKRPLRFVTENHLLGLSEKCRQIVHKQIPHDKASVVCVGYAQYSAEEDGQVSPVGSCPIQAMALIDPIQIDQQENEAPHVRQPPFKNLGRDGGQPHRDDASVLSTAYSTTLGEGSRSASRRSSIGSSSAVTATTTSSSLSGGRSKATDISASPEGISPLDQQNVIADSSVPLAPTSLQPPKARLILDLPGTKKDAGQTYFVFLDYRPLSPCIARWGDTIGIFVGSADDSNLRFYQPCEQGCLLATSRVDLDQEHFGLETPVMRVDFYSDGTSHTLGLVGQDGTIQMVSWHGVAPQFEGITSHRVIVDGPLISLKIQPKDDGRLLAVVGSLCGYVCTLTKEEFGWKGPDMVVQGLWNQRIGDEDSALAVDALGDCIAIGTFGGRCMLYQACRYGTDYKLVWECTLPHSIHGMELRTTAKDSFELCVVTRRSLHTFCPALLSASLVVLPAKYSVTVTNERLRTMLEHRLSNEKRDEAASPTVSSETVMTVHKETNEDERNVDEAMKYSENDTTSDDN